MNDKLNRIVTNITTEELNSFMKNANKKVLKEENNQEIIVDSSWINKVQKIIPILECIINNPKIFNVLDDKDDEIFKDEVINLYENRLICTLINNLYNFVVTQLAFIEKNSFNKREKVVKYKVSNRYENREVKFELKIESEKLDSFSYFDALKTKIISIKEKLEDLKNSNFMKIMVDTVPVRSPLRKISSLLKDNNYAKVLEFWEYLDNFKNVHELKENNEYSVVNNNEDRNFDLIYYLSYLGFVKNARVNNKVKKEVFLDDFKEYISDYGIDDIDLRKELEKMLDESVEYKKEQIKIVSEAFNVFIKEHYKRMKKAIILLK